MTLRSILKFWTHAFFLCDSNGLERLCDLSHMIFLTHIGFEVRFPWQSNMDIDNWFWLCRGRLVRAVGRGRDLRARPIVQSRGSMAPLLTDQGLPGAGRVLSIQSHTVHVSP